MKKQRICIIGDGLAGLTTAITLNNLNNVEVHLIAKKKRNYLDKRATAISESNFKFLKENIVNLNTKLFWPSKNIELFYECNSKNVNFLNLKEEKKNLMYVFENEKIKNILLKEIKSSKIKILYKNIKNLSDLKNYELVILCLGGNSNIYSNIVKKRSIEKDYREKAITGVVKHKIKHLNTSQFFLNEGPMAILPFSKNHFSFVWSLNKEFYELNYKNIKNLVKNKILNILKLKKNLKISNIQSYPIKLRLKRNYYDKNVLILGEGLHTIHPVAGQGFNLVIRDIKKLKEILEYYTGLGISIKHSYALNDFYDQRKPENIMMALGIDMTHNFFKKNQYLDPFKEIILKNISKNNTLKKISKIISNQGLSF
jgi:2-octaprenyl-6-methoxyphenol hydroxylase